ncbi:MAG: class I SAM-dependent methyltransferase, partial [Gammaproteobacteria bacterium]|nr:class I SAM-dependent methyltransferase [Gammaproteobacteria bacterium]
GKPRHFLPPGARYLGIDYFPTATGWYDTRPEVYADARALPLRGGSVDHVLLLDVLEHVPDPDSCLAEIGRTLKPGGRLTIQVPFQYPVHDAPRDFHRWTRYGLQRAANRHGFTIEEEIALGHPLETAALNSNIASSKTVLNWAARRNPLVVLGLLLPIMVVVTNCAAWVLARLSKPDDLMPYAYRMVWARR